ncbi:hypothetical protein K461DRAFT_113137 [Myriangium duriaei CBS 260.36]|uniref:Uncharacterized protein n=1 Tax=Myriangium duriaei CBS 260.36 TaxID=1168546 RepID=A0A9P4J5F1_9PEZI|nr:hypothetical protein K461DRAFT_113137 [Myriangium duriaei CBS 260.36]
MPMQADSCEIPLSEMLECSQGLFLPRIAFRLRLRQDRCNCYASALSCIKTIVDRAGLRIVTLPLGTQLGNSRVHLNGLIRGRPAYMHQNGACAIAAYSFNRLIRPISDELVDITRKLGKDQRQGSIKLADDGPGLPHRGAHFDHPRTRSAPRTLILQLHSSALGDLHLLKPHHGTRRICELRKSHDPGDSHPWQRIEQCTFLLEIPPWFSDISPTLNDDVFVQEHISVVRQEKASRPAKSRRQDSTPQPQAVCDPD